jgi:hypothetical protein
MTLIWFFGYVIKQSWLHWNTHKKNRESYDLKHYEIFFSLTRDVIIVSDLLCVLVKYVYRKYNSAMTVNG